MGLRVYRVLQKGSGNCWPFWAYRAFKLLVMLRLRVTQGFGPEVENGGASVAAF